MLRNRLRSSIKHVGQALREPEQFALRWHQGTTHYDWWVWIALGMTAALGTTTYGMTMGILGGTGEIILKGLCYTLAAALAWAIPLPALYILNSLSGSRLRASTTLLAALVTVSWGGLALIASVPINWFFTVSFPGIVSYSWVPWLVRLVNLVVFAGVGVAAVDVFGRVLECLEPSRGRMPVCWLLVVAAIGTELFYAFGLFDFSVRA